MIGQMQQQPYRKGARQPGAALTAMLKGRTAQGANPSDIQRGMKLTTKTARTPRQPRTPRPTRPTR